MSDQDVYSQAVMADIASRGGALSTTDDTQDTTTTTQGALNRQGASYGAGANSAIDNEGNPGEYSPQDLRTLQLLDNVRGQLAPKHSGNAWAEGYGQAADNQYKTLAAILSANAKARAAMALQGMKNKGSAGVADIRSEASRDVAHIRAQGNTWYDLTPEELRDYPPGTTGQVNALNQKRMHYPPSSQTMQTGRDADGKITYAEPGEALTPAQRSEHQKYIKLAQPIMNQLDDQDPNSLYNKVLDPSNKTAFGGPRLAERAAQGVMGFTGQSTNVAPKDLDLVEQIEQFNSKAAAMLEAAPVLNASVKKALKDDLPDPNSVFESQASAAAKIKRFKTNLADAMTQSQTALRGQAATTGPAGATGAAPRVDPATALAHAKAAIAAGADPEAIKLRLSKMGIDTKGL